MIFSIIQLWLVAALATAYITASGEGLDSGEAVLAYTLSMLFLWPLFLSGWILDGVARYISNRWS